MQIPKGLNPCYSGNCIEWLVKAVKEKFTAKEVLILVIVEIVLSEYKNIDYPIFKKCLNPCYSGNCIECIPYEIKWHRTKVLILVIVEIVLSEMGIQREGRKAITCLNPCYSGNCIEWAYNIYILQDNWSLNPCYSGNCIEWI